MFSRRKLLASVGLGIGVLATGRASLTAANSTADLPDAVGEYVFEKEYRSKTKGRVKVYAKEELDTPMILDPATFYPVRPLTPIRVKRRIAVLENGRIEEFPMIVVHNQHVRCLISEDHAGVRCLTPKSAMSAIQPELGVLDSRYVWVNT